MAKIRVRCQVLEAIESIGECNIMDIGNVLPHLNLKTIQKTCYHLKEEDEIEEIGKSDIRASNGVFYPLYSIRTAKREQLKPRYTKSPSSKKNKLSYPPQFKNKRYYIRFRDKKIKLLKNYLKNASGTTKDLLIGMIQDYENIV